MAECSSLSFTSPELMAQTIGCRFKSYQWLFSSPLFCLLKKNPTLLPYHLLAGAPTMVRSAVQYNQRRLGIVTMYSYYSMLLTLVSLLVCRSPVLSPCLGFTSQVSGIKYPLSHLNSLFCHVSHLLSHISCLISHIFYLISHTFPVSRLLSWVL